MLRSNIAAPRAIYDRLPALAADLVARKVDVIVTEVATAAPWPRSRRPRRSRSSSTPATTRLQSASSPVSPGRAATSTGVSSDAGRNDAEAARVAAGDGSAGRVIALLVEPGRPVCRADHRTHAGSRARKRVDLHCSERLAQKTRSRGRSRPWSSCEPRAPSWRTRLPVPDRGTGITPCPFQRSPRSATSLTSAACSAMATSATGARITCGAFTPGGS